MPQVTVTVHRNGLHPMEAFKAHHKSQELGMSLDEILTEGEIRTLSGRTPGRYAGWLSDSIRLRKKNVPHMRAHTVVTFCLRVPPCGMFQFIGNRHRLI